MDSVHSVAQTGFGTGTNDLYDRARPTYQPFALDYIRKSVRSPAPWNVAEIGSGTGIFTRALLAEPGWNTSIKSFKAVEPSEGMREVFARTVKDDRVSCSDGTFQNTGVENSWADLVVVAQAFHWCPDYEPAALEFSRILKPDGIVVFIWNLEDREAATWVAQVRELIESYEQDTPQFRHMYWRRTFDTPGYQKEFVPPKEKVWTYNLQATKELVVDRASSKSYIAVLPDDRKVEVQCQIRGIIDTLDKVWIDEAAGVFRYPYKVWVIVADKKANGA